MAVNYQKEAQKYLEFSKVEVSEFLIPSFQAFGPDKDGFVEAKKVTVKEVPQDELQKIVVSVDEKKTGKISFAQYLKIVTLAYPDKRKEFDADFYQPWRERFPEFNKEEVDMLIIAFREYDLDGSGAIDQTELDAAFKSMGQHCTPEELQSVISSVDEDGSGEIEWPEFLTIMRNLSPDAVEIYEKRWINPSKKFPQFTREDVDVFVSAFRQFDSDGSGSIDFQELTQMFKYLGQGNNPQQIKSIFDKIDTDKSGAIEWVEFLKMMLELYPEKQVAFEEKYYGPWREGFPEFSKEEIDMFIESFNAYDLDGSGAIDFDELDAAFKSMGQHSSKQEIQNIIAKVSDGGNEVSWPGFLKIMKMISPNEMKAYEEKFFGPAAKFPQFSRDDVETFIKAFRQFDTDGSGSMDAKELEAMFKYMGQGSTSQQIQQMVTKYDTNKSGVIEWSEFLHMMADLYGDKKQVSQVKAATVKAATPTPVKTTVPPMKTTTTATSTTPVKQTGFTPASKPTTTPTKGSFVGAQKPTGTSGSSFGSHRGNPSCQVCGNTVYPIEAINAIDKTWHKGCFKCQHEGCNLVLSLKTFKGDAGKVYCIKHVPKAKATYVQDMATKNAMNAPKLRKAQGIQRDVRLTFTAQEMEEKLKAANVTITKK